MSEAYLVKAKSRTGKEFADTLQVEPGAVVEAEREPLSGERATETGVISGKILLS